MVEYLEALSNDSADKKFEGILADTGAANEFVARAGINLRSQHSENVADEVVSVSSSSGAGQAIGATSDAKVDTDTTGTISGKLRGIVSRLVEMLARFPAVLGQTTKSGSMSVVIASDQESFPAAAVGDNVGVNVVTEIRGMDRRTQNGDPVCDLGVNVTNQPVAAGPDLSRFDDNTAGADQIVTVGATHVHLGALHANTTHVLISVEDAEIRYRTDGTDPTSTVGHRLEPRNSVVWVKARAARASFIRGYTGLKDATLHVSQLIEVAILTKT